jgi:hypothetical protein
VGSLSSSIPQVPLPSGPHEHETDPPTMWGGEESEPTRSAELIRDPVLRAAFLRAYRAWEKRQ